MTGSQQMHLVITIDAEEDTWGPDGPGNYTVENIRRIPGLQRLFDDFGVAPTYFVSYPVASDENASSILRSILADGRCEIGTHCHPWNTPPFAATPDPERDSFLCNLPAWLQGEKLARLHETIERAFDTPPVSFRCGRWGFRPEMAKHLVDLGYRIDTSVTPYTDWTPLQGPDFSTIPPRPFHLGQSNLLRISLPRPLLELPVTIGFLQSNFPVCNAIWRSAQRRPLRYMRLCGILDRLGIVTKVWLSPEVSTASQMIELTKRMRQQHCEILNLTFHSSSLQAGLTPFVRTVSDEHRFLGRLRDYLEFARSAGITPITLSRAMDLA